MVEEFLPIVSVDEAEQALDALAVSGRIAEEEEVPLAAALGRVTSRPVHALEDVPGFDRTAMDGYAVRAEDTAGASPEQPTPLRVAFEVPMGGPAPGAIGPGEAAIIHTGGMIPAGADAVVILEHTDQGRDMLQVLAPVTAGKHVIVLGEDMRVGDEVLSAGHRIRPQDVAALSGCGSTSVSVYRRLRVAVFSTGNEVIPAGFPGPLGPGQVREMNGPAVVNGARALGADADYLGIVLDSEEEIYAALARGVETYDVVLVSGGSSVGTRDAVASAIGRLGEPGILVHGIAVRPGKPTVLASVNHKPVIGLPGHPGSTMVIFCVFVAPLIRRLSGEEPLPPPPIVSAVMGCDRKSPEGFVEFVRVSLTPGDPPVATPIPGGSSAITTLVRAHGLARVPAEVTHVRQGERVSVLLF